MGHCNTQDVTVQKRTNDIVRKAAQRKLPDAIFLFSSNPWIFCDQLEALFKFANQKLTELDGRFIVEVDCLSDVSFGPGQNLES